MRLRVRHVITYSYEPPVAYAIQAARLTPRPYEGLRVFGWLVSRDGRRELPYIVDGFGNVVHTHTMRQPHRQHSTIVIGEVESADTSGIVRGAPEPLPPLAFLRPTPLTQVEGAVADFAAEATRGLAGLDRLQTLMQAVRDRVDHRRGGGDLAIGAAEALERGTAQSQDHAHLFIAAARALAIPARYIGGYLWTGRNEREGEASHGWAEAFVAEVGWIGFDPTNRVCPDEKYIRTSVGLDYWSAAPVRGIRRGEGDETLAIDVQVMQAGAEQ